MILEGLLQFLWNNDCLHSSGGRGRGSFSLDPFPTYPIAACDRKWPTYHRHRPLYALYTAATIPSNVHFNLPCTHTHAFSTFKNFLTVDLPDTVFICIHRTQHHGMHSTCLMCWLMPRLHLHVKFSRNSHARNVVACGYLVTVTGSAWLLQPGIYAALTWRLLYIRTSRNCYVDPATATMVATPHSHSHQKSKLGLIHVRNHNWLR